MSMKNKIRSPRRNPPRKQNGTSATAGEAAVRAMLIAFVGGAGLCAALLAVFALLLSNTPLPIILVRPLACMAAAAGAALSGFLLAKIMGKQLLLCGLGCGAFWAACQSLAAVALNGQNLLQGGNLMLPIALLLGGVLGGALAAVWAVH